MCISIRTCGHIPSIEINHAVICVFTFSLYWNWKCILQSAFYGRKDDSTGRYHVLTMFDSKTVFALSTSRLSSTVFLISFKTNLPFVALICTHDRLWPTNVFKNVLKCFQYKTILTHYHVHRLSINHTGSHCFNKLGERSFAPPSALLWSIMNLLRVIWKPFLFACSRRLAYSNTFSRAFGDFTN